MPQMVYERQYLSTLSHHLVRMLDMSTNVMYDENLYGLIFRVDKNILLDVWTRLIIAKLFPPIVGFGGL